MNFGNSNDYGRHQSQKDLELNNVSLISQLYDSGCKDAVTVEWNNAWKTLGIVSGTY